MSQSANLSIVSRGGVDRHLWRGEAMNNSHASWRWTRRFAIGLSCSVAAFAVWGALAPHIAMAAAVAPIMAGGLLAAFYGNAQGLANCCAANARRALQRGEGYRLPAAFFIACFGGFACLSVSGLHSAWEFVKANASGAPLPDDTLMRNLFWFVAFAEPALSYGVEAIKSLAAAETIDEERTTLDAAAERENRQRDAEARRKALYLAAAPAMVVATVSAAAVAPREFPFEPIPHSAPADAMTESHTAHGWRGPRDERRWARWRLWLSRSWSSVWLQRLFD